jgi:N-acetylglucosaminyldiphosphoundecaprenol N-acetyl-beta-D-mannosaminyltransferase
MPVLWASRLLGTPLPEKVSGSDLVLPLMDLAAQRGYRVYFVGGAEGAAEKSATILRERFPGLCIVGHDASRIDINRPAGSIDPVAERAAAAKPDLVLVALGAPKQEIWCHQHRDVLKPAVLVAIGAGLDFIAGFVKRAPAWMSRTGFEWLFRLAQEPRRLASRYLVRDPQFALVVARQALAQRRERESH